MIIPNKHIYLKNSLLNVGAILIKRLTEPKTISELWSEVNSLKEIRSFEIFVLGIDLLFTLNVLALKEGLLVRNDNIYIK